MAAGADADEAHNLAASLCDELGGPAPVAFGCFLDRQCLQLLRGKRVRVCGLPGLDLDACDSFGVSGCPGANHRGEPTLQA